MEKLIAPPEEIGLGMANAESWNKVLLTLGLAMAARRAENPNGMRPPLDRAPVREIPPGLRDGASAEERAQYFGTLRDSIQKMKTERERKNADFLKSARIDYQKLLQTR